MKYKIVYVGSRVRIFCYCFGELLLCKENEESIKLDVTPESIFEFDADIADAIDFVCFD